MVGRLKAALARVLSDAGLRRRLEDQGLNGAASNAADFARIIDHDLDHDLRKYAHLAQQAGLSPE